ncbi:hypothetical protein DXG03_002061 [Asterophora parasitica]|uniref:Uncharacterized protein n=1 Tax=Asterophora parasitica TaxID=117018 RepID=A0A9P7G4T9_9AGAR|nr:hypothetical protein DXG03_002061 [Asterophora parasitica]
MERDPVTQERDIKDSIRRAKGIPDKTGSLRRETLKRLIDLTHSPHPSLKIIAAQNIRFLFNDFPELEEEAINAVYDLCEDQAPKVRIEGYTAITHLSNASHRLIRRNADVLLQLLQSDEADEVNVVKKALTEHLDMDPKVTLSVLCDQIAPEDDSAEEEERSRLRDVVLKFLTGARRAIVERHALPGSEAEEALVDALVTAIPKLELRDVEIIVEDLLMPLKAFRVSSARGHTLLQALLNKVAEHLQKGTRSGDVSLLHSAQPYLDLASFVVVEKQAAPAIQLLRFYCTSISTKMTLQKFSKDDQRLIVSRLAATLVTANKNPQPENEGVPLETLRRQVVDSCPFLLESLVPPPASPPVIATAQAPQAHTSQATGAMTSLHAPRSGLPARPLASSSSYPARRMHIASASSSRPQDHDQAMTNPPASSLSQQQASRPAKHQVDLQPSTRPPKRQRSSEDVDADSDAASPSLLARLGTTLSGAPTPANVISNTSHAHPAAAPSATSGHQHQHLRTSSLVISAAQRPRKAPPAADPPPNGEWSIKGAATLEEQDAPAPVSTLRRNSSLLQRLQGEGHGAQEDRGAWRGRRGRP